MDEKNTPRTDALPRIRQAGETEYVPIDDCRQLERELAEMTKKRDHYKTACDQYSEDKSLNMLAEARSAVKNLTHCIISAQGVDAVGRCVALIRRQEEILGPLGPINDFRLAELLSHSLQQPAELKFTQLTKQRDTLAEALDYIAYCGLSARHLADYAKEKLAAVKGDSHE
jgi:hypothetical protein